MTPEELIENIDIGGPAMVRSAAKNFESVAVVTDPSDYDAIAKEIEETRGVSLADAARAGAQGLRADGALRRRNRHGTRAAGGERTRDAAGRARSFRSALHVALERRQAMRYGENPHQSAALYVPAGRAAAGLAGAKQLQGKELSYNNLVDLDAAWALVKEFAAGGRRSSSTTILAARPNRNLCVDAYLKALACDPVSAFGGVLAFNRALDAATAEEVAKLFVECIVAPGYEPAALEKFAAKKNARLLEIAGRGSARRSWS